MKITEMSVTDISPYANNPRNNEKAVDLVANSIREFGFNQPIVVDKNNVIVVGHTRWLAAQELGIDKVPVYKAENLTEQEAKAYRLADNKTAEESAWDFEALEAELDDIDMDMSQFGFENVDLSNIDDLFEDAEQKEKSEGTDHIITCPHCGKEIAVDDHFEVSER